MLNKRFEEFLKDGASLKSVLMSHVQLLEHIRIYNLICSVLLWLCQWSDYQLVIIGAFCVRVCGLCGSLLQSPRKLFQFASWSKVYIRKHKKKPAKIKANASL